MEETEETKWYLADGSGSYVVFPTVTSDHITLDTTIGTINPSNNNENNGK